GGGNPCLNYIGAGSAAVRDGGAIPRFIAWRAASEGGTIDSNHPAYRRGCDEVRMRPLIHSVICGDLDGRAAGREAPRRRRRAAARIRPHAPRHAALPRRHAWRRLVPILT